MIKDEAYPCPKCGGACEAVKDSRPTTYNGEFTIRRRRACASCDHRISTVELPIEFIEITRAAIVKKIVSSLIMEALK